MATEARSSFLPITGEFAVESSAAAQRFAAAVRAADESTQNDDPGRAWIAQLAARAFAGDAGAWRPLVMAVRDFLVRPAQRTGGVARARRELRAFVAENADLLDD